MWHENAEHAIFFASLTHAPLQDFAYYNNELSLDTTLAGAILQRALAPGVE